MSFNVEAVISTGNRELMIIFGAAPDPTQAAVADNYAIDGLTVEAPLIDGMTVTLQTSPQAAIDYTVIASNITRASDAASLTVDTAVFTGRTSFNVTAADVITAATVQVTFDAPPDPIAAIDPQSYTIDQESAIGAALDGNVVTVQFQPVGAADSVVVVNHVVRASDLESLTVNAAMFTSRTPFSIDAESVSDTSIAVTFSDPPDPIAATSVVNYVVDGPTLSGATLVGNTVTFTTSPQQSFLYTVLVSGVARMSDSEPLDQSTATFYDPELVPTLTNVVVISTVPNNGTTPYSTGTVTLQITGTQLGTVECPGGVGLADLDGAGIPVNTQASSCNADSDTQVSASFPTGIRTNGTLGWPVEVTNGTGVTAVQGAFVPLAGLLISEVYLGSSAADDHEFIELYVTVRGRTQEC